MAHSPLRRVPLATPNADSDAEFLIYFAELQPMQPEQIDDDVSAWWLSC